MHPIVKRHIKLWYRNKLDEVIYKPLHQARQLFLQPLPVPNHYESHTQLFKYKNFIIKLFYPHTIKTNSATTPILIFLRASGYAFGNHNNHNLPATLLSHHLQWPVAAIEHRLAPETKYPGPLNDCEKAIEWLLTHPPIQSLHQNNLYLWSECSGANLALALCHRLAQRNQNPFKKHITFYPPVDHTFNQGSKITCAKGYMIDLKILRYVTQLYLNNPKEIFLPDVSPNLNPSFEHLPPTTLHVGQFDLFRDETKTYIEKLQKANITAQYHCHPGLVHGFTQYYGQVPQVTQIINNEIRQLKQDHTKYQAQFA